MRDERDTRRPAGADIEAGTPVEVHSSFSGQWHNGFIVARADNGGYWLARADRTLLPAPVARGRVRQVPPD